MPEKPDRKAQQEAIEELLAHLAGAIGQLVLTMHETIADIHRLLEKNGDADDADPAA